MSEYITVLAIMRNDGRHRLMNMVEDAKHFILNYWETRHVPRHRELIRKALEDMKAARKLLG
jgi:hypothetical protein